MQEVEPQEESTTENTRIPSTPEPSTPSSTRTPVSSTQVPNTTEYLPKKEKSDEDNTDASDRAVLISALVLLGAFGVGMVVLLCVSICISISV